MKKSLLFVVLPALFLCGSAMAGASFMNSGFDNGSLDGWQLSSDSGSPNFVSPAAGATSFASNGNGGQSALVMTPGADPATGMPLVYSGHNSVRVGDELPSGFAGGGTAYNRVRQSATVTDDGAGGPGFLYFAWAAVEQLSDQSTGQIPSFEVSVDDTTTGTTVYDLRHFATDAGSWTTDGGWNYSNNRNPASPNFPPHSANTLNAVGWSVVRLDLAALGVSVGDNLTLSAMTRDCAACAHATYVYLDGFGSTLPQSVPEPASLALVSVGLAALGIARRRKS